MVENTKGQLKKKTMGAYERRGEIKKGRKRVGRNERTKAGRKARIRIQSVTC